MKWYKGLAAPPVVLTLALVPVLDRAGADGDDNPVYPLDSLPPSPNDNAALVLNEEALQLGDATVGGAQYGEHRLHPPNIVLNPLLNFDAKY